MLAVNFESFRYRPISEIHRVQDTLKSYRRFEPESFNAGRMVQPDLFRIEQRGTKSKWQSPKGFVVGKTAGIPDTNALRSLPAKHVSGAASMTVYNPEASTGFRLTNNSLAHASIDELKESASVYSKLHEPYHRVNLANTRGLGGMKKRPSQSSMSPKHSSRTNITQINAFH